MEATAFIAQIWPPRTNPLSYPPYHPPEIQRVGQLAAPNELIMSDIPWAVAWYGQRECVTIPLNPSEEFLNIYDYVKPVNELYLTEKTLNIDLLPELTLSRPDPNTWRHFALTAGINEQLPANFPDGTSFPLNSISSSVFVSGMLFTDHPR
jgi:hypothetical protein